MEASRIESARRQLRLVRFGIGAAAVAGFAVFALAARAAHPGTSGHASSGAEAQTSRRDEHGYRYGDESTQSFRFGSGSIGAAGGAPSVQSGGS